MAIRNLVKVVVSIFHIIYSSNYLEPVCKKIEDCHEDPATGQMQVSTKEHPCLTACESTDFYRPHHPATGTSADNDGVDLDTGVIQCIKAPECNTDPAEGSISYRPTQYLRDLINMQELKDNDLWVEDE